jgi:hypothetical protein
VARLYDAVVIVGSRVPIDIYFSNLPDPKQIAVTAIFDMELLTGDFILVSARSFILT